MQNFVFREKVTMKKAEKTPETLRFSGVFLVPYYTIPRIKRELKLCRQPFNGTMDYTIPRIKRELKHFFICEIEQVNYTIPRIKRELKLIDGAIKIDGNYTIPRIKRELKPVV